MILPFHSTTIVILEVAAVVLGILLGTLYLELGYVLFPLIGAGAVAAVLVTRRQWRRARRRALALAGVLVTYVAVTVLAYRGLLGREHEATHTMRWESRGSDNQWKATEVRLYFVNYPGHYIGEYSDALYDHLAGRGQNPVAVRFAVSTDLGWCIRGFHATDVAGLRAWRSAWGYAGSHGEGPSPWRSPWWCP